MTKPIRQQLIWSKFAGSSYTDPLKRNISCEPFSRLFLSKCDFVLLWVAGSERLHSKFSPLNSGKASKNQKEILAYTLENGCSKTGKAQRERLCRSPILEMLHCNFTKTRFYHRRVLPRNVPTFFRQTTSQNIREWLIGKFV